MGFLKSGALAPFPGILLTLSSSVSPRFLPPAELSGCSKQAMVPHLHNSHPPGQPRKEHLVCVHQAQA